MIVESWVDGELIEKKNQEMSLNRSVLAKYSDSVVFYDLSGKIKPWGKHLKSWDPFGLYIVEGSFGAGKTYNTFLEAYLRKLENSNGLLIANVPYSFVDIFYSSYEDFSLLLKFFHRFLIEHNDDCGQFFTNIRWVIDEAHVYFFTRDFAKFDRKLVFLMTQVRKVGISFYIITQSRKNIDSFVRTLAPDSIYYSRQQRPLTPWVKREILYYDDPDNTNPDQATVEESMWLSPMFLDKLFHKKQLLPFWSEKKLSKYLVGLHHEYFDLGFKLDIKTGEEKQFLKPILDYEGFGKKIARFYPVYFNQDDSENKENDLLDTGQEEQGQGFRHHQIS